MQCASVQCTQCVRQVSPKYNNTKLIKREAGKITNLKVHKSNFTFLTVLCNRKGMLCTKGCQRTKRRRRTAQAHWAFVVSRISGFRIANMEVFVVTPNLKFSCWTFPVQSSIQDVVDRFGQQQVSFDAFRVHTWQTGCLPGVTLARLANKQTGQLT